MLSTQSNFSARNAYARQLLGRIRNTDLAQYRRDAAREELFDAFKNLALSAALKMVRRYVGCIDDLESESALALLTAIDYWQPEKGDFSTAIYYCLRVRLRQYFRSQEIISRSYSALLKASKCRKEGVDPGRYDAVRCDSLDVQWQDNSTCGTEDLTREFADERAEFADTVTLTVAVQQAVNALPQHERKAVILTYGLYGHDPHTLRDAAARLQCSHEKVRLALRHANQTLHQTLSGCA